MRKKGEKLATLLKQLAAEFLENAAGKQSLITVTDIHLKESKQVATILFSVYPEEFEEDALSFAKRKRSEFRDYLKTHARLRTVPRIDFEIDKGERNRRRIEELLKKK